MYPRDYRPPGDAGRGCLLRRVEPGRKMGRQRRWRRCCESFYPLEQGDGAASGSAWDSVRRGPASGFITPWWWR
jgi:hypothetical protein